MDQSFWGPFINKVEQSSHRQLTKQLHYLLWILKLIQCSTRFLSLYPLKPALHTYPLFCKLEMPHCGCMTLPTTEVAVKLNFNHVILEAKSGFVPNTKKFPEDIVSTSLRRPNRRPESLMRLIAATASHEKVMKLQSKQS